MTSAQRQEWITYRNALQDMDASVPTPIFPQIPAEPIFPLTAGQISERAEIAGYLQTISSHYQAAVDRLMEIETSANPPFTQAGFNLACQAIRDIAKDVREIGQALKKLLT